MKLLTFCLSWTLLSSCCLICQDCKTCTTFSVIALLLATPSWLMIIFFCWQYFLYFCRHAQLLYCAFITIMMATLLHPSDYKHGIQNVPVSLLVLQAHCCQTVLEWNVLHVPWNNIWLGHHHRASGMHRSKCFTHSNKFTSPVSTREFMQSQMSLVFMMPDDFSPFESIYFPCPRALAC